MQTEAQVYELAAKKFKTASIETLKEAAITLFSDYSQPDSIALDIVMHVLQNRMPAAEFIAFSDSL